MQKIGIIGAGFTGLSAAYSLLKRGYEIAVFDKESIVGGLAAGFKADNWNWFLEKHYHHFFTNDFSAINLMKELKCDYQILSPSTDILKNGIISRFDSPISLLKFPELNFKEKARVALMIGFFKMFNYPKSYENITAWDLIPKLIGKHAFDVLFSPLFKSKFGDYAEKISAVWFWARINKRTTRLLYPSFGYQVFADKIAENIKTRGGQFFLKNSIKNIKKNSKNNNWIVESECQTQEFDKILLTIPFSGFHFLIPEFPLPKIQHLDALNLILETKKAILEKTYWLNINDSGYPFLAMVQHTNLVDKKNYNNHHICYLGNYLSKKHEYFDKTKEEIIDLYLPYIKKINPNFEKKDIINSFLFHGVNAQPVVTTGYKNMLPDIDLSMIDKIYEGLFMANMDMVYPWDRGVNYAIDLGQKAAEKISNN